MTEEEKSAAEKAKKEEWSTTKKVVVYGGTGLILVTVGVVIGVALKDSEFFSGHSDVSTQAADQI